jgi:hypothetical protein
MTEVKHEAPPPLKYEAKKEEPKGEAKMAAPPKELDKFAEKARDEKAIQDMKEAASLKIQAKRDPGYNKRD